MSKSRNIHSIAELKERKAALAAESEAARNGLTSALAEAPEKAKDYALEDLALPALGIGLAAYVGYRVVRKRQHDQARLHYAENGMPSRAYVPPAHQPPRKSSAFSLGGLIAAGKLLIPVAQAVIGVIQNQQANNQG